MGSDLAAVRALDAFDASRLTSDLLKIQSPTGEEAACARFLAGWFRSHGVRAATTSLAPGRANIEAVIPGQSHGPTLLLFGHLDTSYPANRALRTSVIGERPGGSTAARGPRRGWFVGQDAYNMRAGLAAAAVAVAAVRRSGVRLAGTLRFAGLAGESEKAPVRTPMADFVGSTFRGAGYGARRYLRAGRPIDFAVSAGPSAMHVVNAQAGAAFVEIVIRGAPAYMDRGRDPGDLGALAAVGPLIQAIRSWADAHERRSVYDTGLGRLRPSVTVGAIQAGWPFSPAWSPATCRVFVTVRTNPGQTTRAVVDELGAAVQACRAGAPGLRFDVSAYHAVESAITPRDSPLVRGALAQVATVTGADGSEFPDGAADATNDTNVFRAAGIPTIQLGPGERRAGGSGSFGAGAVVPEADIRRAAEIYTRLAISLCGLADDAHAARADSRAT